LALLLRGRGNPSSKRFRPLGRGSNSPTLKTVQPGRQKKGKLREGWMRRIGVKRIKPRPREEMKK
jgi:hypothetical protein